MIKLKARASTINATSTEKLREYANDDGTFDETTQAAIRAELARREQAQAPQHTPGPWGVGYGEDRVITIGPYPCVVADCAPNDELSLEEVAANAALIARAPELLAENARLRSLLAECVDIIDVLMMDDGILSEQQYAAIEAAKEAVNG